jgi:tRNA-dihydrouridine synthase B
LQINSLLLENPLVLAPLAGYSDLAFRVLCREFGAGICYSEMISSHGLVYRKPKTLEMIRSIPEDRPIAIQLFGAVPEIMGEAAAMLAEEPIDLIDINMGCPVKKVVKKGAGAALMKNPKLAASIMKSVYQNTSLPVTVKIRSGWKHDSINAPEFAIMAEDHGVAAIAVHGRTWSQGFGGTADWRIVSQVKKTVTIPVIGNGDITSQNEAVSKLHETGCDGIMIGRSALGNPWVFSPEGRPNSLSKRMTGLQRHLELIQKYSDTRKNLGRIKNHSGRYFKGVPGGSVIRRKIYDAKSFNEIMAITAAE